MKIDRKKFEVSSDDLRFTYDPGKIKNLKERTANEFIGQKKALKSLDLGIKIRANGYHIAVTGLNNSGRSSLIRSYLEKYVCRKNQPVDLKDFCLVYNFQHHDSPTLLTLEKGMGSVFKEKVWSLKRQIRQLLEDKSYQDEMQALDEELAEKTTAINRDLAGAMAKLGLIRNEKGLYVTESKKNPGKKISEEEFDRLTAKEQNEIGEKEKRAKDLAKEYLKNYNAFAAQAEEKSKKIAELKIKDIIKAIFSQSGCQNASTIKFLNELEKYIVDHFYLFEPQKPAKSEQEAIRQHEANEELSLRFKVNVLVDNGETKLAPIVFEDHPTFKDFFGRVKKKFFDGAYLTDHTMVSAGSLLKANGGYLIVDVYELLTLGVWDKLKRSLKNNALVIEGANEYYGQTSALHLPPIPLNVKLIAICDPWLYNLLESQDKGLGEIFGVKVEFDSVLEANDRILDGCARFIGDCALKEGLLPLNVRAIARIVEHAVELAEDKKKVTAQFGRLRKLAIESNFWAQKDQAKEIDCCHVQKAIKENRERKNLIEDKYREHYRRNIKMVKVTGKEIGVVNGAAIIQIDNDLMFGLPLRTSATSWCGTKGIISIQREIGTSGHSSNKAIQTIIGWYGQKFGQDMPLAFNASISFEQTIWIDGDSASAAELISLLSQQSKISVNQAISITGSLSQMGEIEPIGGVNDKISGFFDTCVNLGGLTGNQGFIVPDQEVEELTLREDIVEACKMGKFHIYHAKNIDEALEILLDRPAAEVYKLVKEYLRQNLLTLKNSEKKEDSGKKD